MSSSILNLFLQGDGMSGACSGSITSWLCIAVPQRSAHFPTFNPALPGMSQVLSTLSNFGDRTRAGAFSVTWPLAKVRVNTESLIE